jgi:hypothetical protein
MKPLDRKAIRRIIQATRSGQGWRRLHSSLGRRAYRGGLSAHPAFAARGGQFLTASLEINVAADPKGQRGYRPAWPVVVDGIAGGGIDPAVFCIRMPITPVRTSTTVRAHTPRMAVHLRMARVPRRSSLRVISPGIARSLC